MRRWLAEPTRFAGWPPARARWALAAALLLALACVAATLSAPAPPADVASGLAHASEDRADVRLYEGVIARVRAGEPYYPAAAAALREGSFPLRPFVTFRLPTLAWAEAAVPRGAPVAGVAVPGDPVPPGWTRMHGPGLFVRAVTAATGLSLLPAALAAPLVARALLGWSGWRDGLALRALGTVAAFALLIGAAARPDTWYWALFAAVPLLPGLAFAPDALGDLVRRARA